MIALIDSQLVLKSQLGVNSSLAETLDQGQTSSTSLTAFSNNGRASSMAEVAVSAASNTLLRPFESIWRAILVQM